MKRMEDHKMHDNEIGDLLQKTELKKFPEDLKKNIMTEVRSYSFPRKKTIAFLQIAAILLFVSFLLLPYTLKYLSGFIELNLFSQRGFSTILSTNLSFALMIIFASLLLLMAERIFSLFFTGKTLR